MPAPPEDGLPGSESSTRDLEDLLRSIQGDDEDLPRAIRRDRAKRRWFVLACVVSIGLEWAVAVVAGNRIDGARWALICVIPSALVTITLWATAIDFVPDHGANFNVHGYSRKLRGRADAFAFGAIVAAILTGGFGYLAVHAAALERLPATRVTGQVDDCNTRGRCWGMWSVDGHTYSDDIPFTPYRDKAKLTRRQHGDLVSFDVLAQRPDVVVTRAHPSFDHGAVRVAATATGMLCVLWLAFSAVAAAPLRRLLREEARR